MANCRLCQDPKCPGPGLRDYSTWEDLIAHNDDAQIIRWVNELAEKKTRNTLAHAKYNKKQQAFARAAKAILGKEELDRIEREASEEAERIKGIQI